MHWKAFFRRLLLVSALASALVPCLALGQATAPAGGSSAPETPAIPHGTLHHEKYATRFVKGLAGDLGEFVVYTPPGYDPARKPGYPVLYLLHGWSDDVDGWVKKGQADLNMDRMLANGRTVPMVVVMPLGYGDMSFLSNGFEVWRDQDQMSNNVNRFGDTLLKEIMPEVAKKYDVATDREHTAIAGLSMGGQEALTIGLRHPEVFASVGGFSSAIYPVAGQDLTRLDGKKANLKVLYIACGTEDDLLSINRVFALHLKDQGFQVREVETLGKHTWMVWRENLRQFVPMLFKDEALDKLQRPGG